MNVGEMLIAVNPLKARNPGSSEIEVYHSAPFFMSGHRESARENIEYTQEVLKLAEEIQNCGSLVSYLFKFDPDSGGTFFERKNKIIRLGESISTLLEGSFGLPFSRKFPKPAHKLFQEAADVFENQTLANAISSTAEGVKQKLSLIVYGGNLYCRCGVRYQLVDQESLFELVSRIDDPRIGSICAGHSEKSRRELFKRLLTMPDLRVDTSDIHASPLCLPCRDGVYDAVTKKVRPVTDDEYFLYELNINARSISSAEGRYTRQYLDSITGGDPAAETRFFEATGVILFSGFVKAFILFYGPHDSGKSVYARVLRRILGEESVVSIADPKNLAGKWTFGNLPSKKLCYCPDVPNGYLDASAVAAIKQMTGGDLLEGQRKGVQPFSFMNEAVLLMISNFPLSAPADEAFASRMVAVQFQNTVLPENRIHDLEDRLFEEAGYIVYRAAQAYCDLVNRNYQFTPVDYQEVLLESNGQPLVNADSISMFIEARCVLEEGVSTSTEELYADYQNFCDETGLSQVTSKAVFGRSLNKIEPSLESSRHAGGNGVRGFKGIRLKEF